MRKSIGKAFIQWLFLILLLVLLLFFQGDVLILGILLTWVLLPPVTWLCNLWIKKYLFIDLKIEPNVSKGKNTTGIIRITNKSMLPMFRIFAKIQVKNRLTKETDEMYLPVCILPNTRTETPFHMNAQYCGYIDITVDAVYMMDWIGFIPWKVPQDVKKHMAVLPDTFEPHVYVQLSAERTDDAENWSDVKKGNDQSELFALREYVPGDNIKQIHWKLSAKKNQTIIKESSLPVEKSMMLFWNKNVKLSTAAEMDAMAESIASIGQTIINQGIPFVLGWTDGGNCVYETIDYEEQLLQAIPRMLKYGAETDVETELSEAINSFSKVLLFAGAVPESEQAVWNDRTTMIICDKELSDPHHNIIAYSADTYMEDLENIEV